MTEGEYRVGIDFNPSSSSAVGAFKGRTAILIDEMNTLIKTTGTSNAGAARCAALAMTEYENACMWAVKALTKQLKE